jgi:hypothetical protein
MVHKGLVPNAWIIVWFSRAWKSVVVDKVEEAQHVLKVMLGKYFPKPWGDYKTDSGLV